MCLHIKFSGYASENEYKVFMNSEWGVPRLGWKSDRKTLISKPECRESFEYRFERTRINVISSLLKPSRVNLFNENCARRRRFSCVHLTKLGCKKSETNRFFPLKSWSESCKIIFLFIMMQDIERVNLNRIKENCNNKIN